MLKRTLLISIMTVWIAAPLALLAENADSLYRNGRIYTVNDEQPWAEAIAIKDGRIFYVGSNDGAQAYAGKKTKVIDLKGRMVMPGIHDAHSHMVWGGLNKLFECRLPLGAPLDGLIGKLKECEQGLSKEDWLIAGSVWSEQLPEGRFNKALIDEAFPERPVYIVEGSQHHAFVNSRALAVAGIDRNTPDPQGGRLVRDDRGELTGEIVEAATVLVSGDFKQAPMQQNLQALEWASKLFSRFGITSTQEASGNEAMLKTFSETDRNNKLKQYVAAHIIWGSPKFARASDAEMEALIEKRHRFSSPRLSTDFVKMWIDGSPTPPYFTEGSIDFDTHEVRPENILIPPERLNKFVIKMDRLGIKAKMHVAGAGAAHIALDAVAAARQANPDSTIIHELGHTNLLIPADFPRMQQLRVAGDMSPTIWHLYGPTLGNPPLPAWQFRTLNENGVLMTIGTDWPVTDEPNVFPAIQGLLDRGYESLELDLALKMLTLNGAISLGWQDRMGSIEVSKLANFIVLDQNLFEIPATEIGTTRVMLTVFEGEVVYEAGTEQAQ